MTKESDPSQGSHIKYNSPKDEVVVCNLSWVEIKVTLRLETRRPQDYKIVDKIYKIKRCKKPPTPTVGAFMY